MPEYDFAVGNPDPGSFPSEGLAEAAARVLARQGELLSVYPEQRGYVPLREIASNRFQRLNGVDLSVSNIALTNGSMQAINLICQTFVKPGDTIMAEEYCYSGSLNCFRKYEANIVSVAMDDDGMRMDSLEEKLSSLERDGVKPKFIYTIPTNQNPTGTMMPESRREQLIEIARAHSIPVVEDDCYSDLIFEGSPPRSMYSYAPDTVIYLGSFSKILGPGARLGYFSAEEDTLMRILYWKIDAGTSNLAAFVAAEYFKQSLWDHIDTVNVVIKEKLDLVFEKLDANPDVFVSHSHPRGGLFIWVNLPPAVDPLRLAEVATAHGVKYGLGKAFHAAGQNIPALRIAYGHASLEDIRDGLPLLADCVRETLGLAVAASPEGSRS